MDADHTDQGLVDRLAGAEGYTVPENVENGDTYRLNHEGVWRRHETKNDFALELIAFRPFIISRRLRDDQGGTRFELAWLTDDDQVRSVTLDSSVTRDRNRLLHAMPDQVITSKHAMACVEYVSQLMRGNRAWLVERGVEVMTALGWAPEGTELFVSGPDQPCPVDDTKNTGKWLKGHRQRGTIEGWKAAVNDAADQSLIQVMVTAALAAPLLRVLDVPSFAVDLSGSTSGGKTISLRLAAAAWGDPHDLTLSWKTTRVAIEHHLSMVRGMPLCVDESQLAHKVEDVEDVIYGLTEGKSKGRSKQDGSALMDGAAWESILLTTGEQPIVSMTKKGGVVPRAITLTGQPCRDKAQADALKEAARQHHGHAGPAFVDLLLTLDGGDLRARYDEIRHDLSARVTSNVAGRRADSVAVLVLANELAVKADLMPEIKLETWDWLAEGGGALQDDEDDRPRAALRAVLGWAAVNTARFFNHPDAIMPPHDGWAGRWDVGKYVSFHPETLRKKLKDFGYDDERVITDWRDRGWLRHQPGKNTHPVRIGGSTPRHIYVTEIAEITAPDCESVTAEPADPRIGFVKALG